MLNVDENCPLAIEFFNSKVLHQILERHDEDVYVFDALSELITEARKMVKSPELYDASYLIDMMTPLKEDPIN